MSKQYKALLQERADLKKEQDDLFAAVEREGRAMTDAEKERDDAIHARQKEIAADIDRHERRREWERTVTVPGNLAQVSGEPDDHHPFKSLGEQLSAVVVAKQAPAYADPRLEKYNRLMAATGLSEATLADGGAFVQTDYSNELMDRTYQTGKVLPRVQDQPIGANSNAYSALLIKETSRATGSRYGGLRVYRTGEGATITSSRPEFERKEIRPYELAALCYLTNTLVSDATQLEGHIRRLFPLEASFVMEDELFNGTGAGQSLGLLNAPAIVSVAKETGQAATTLKYENVIRMWARMWTGSAGNAVWYANQDTFPEWMQMFLAAGTAGIPAQAVTFVNGKFTAFGAPVEFVEYAKTLGTTGDVYLADFNQYLGVRKGDVKIDSSIHVAFVTNEMALRFVWRYAAEPLWRSALTPANGSATLSPFVKLDTRS